MTKRLIGVILCTGIFAALGTPLVVALHHSQDRNRVVMCANNLSQLWKMQNIYMSQFGGRMKLMPTETGTGFWLKLTKTTPPLIDKDFAELLQCPVQNKDEGFGSCDYRGPAENVAKSAFGDPVGADIETNHGAGKGGNVLTKAGDVTTVSATEDLWKLASQKTTGGPAATLAPAPQDLESRVKALESEVRRLKLMLLLNYCADSSGGHVNRDHFAFLGVGFEYLKKETSETFGLSEGEGMKVTVVKADGPAGLAGIGEGDVLLRAGGVPLKSSGIYTGGERGFMLANYVTRYLPGEAVEIEVIRKGEKRKVRVLTTCKTCGEKCPFWN